MAIAAGVAQTMFLDTGLYAAVSASEPRSRLLIGVDARELRRNHEPPRVLVIALPQRHTQGWPKGQADEAAEEEEEEEEGGEKSAKVYPPQSRHIAGHILGRASVQSVILTPEAQEVWRMIILPHPNFKSSTQCHIGPDVHPCQYSSLSSSWLPMATSSFRFKLRVVYAQGL
ncbi:hypothetical protein FIBSPDRAFT_860006 [Athelia psychrophila]|uniref:Uncharacterized protein n=1 Tax=Athelia psychrophila TaxID=1759441 RepID=A0A166KP35_9AGAM|nr:hypothetical protein FIBSPDRAFT_860006 [Fibularhizoctonia sp. CBS 109695]